MSQKNINLSFIVLFFISCLFFSLTGSSADIYIWRDLNDIKQISNVKPDWWTDEMNQMLPGEVVEPVDKPDVSQDKKFPGKFVGDKENKKFHVPTCEQIYTSDKKMAIPDNKIIWFDTFEDATSKGYVACGHCKPTAGSSAKSE
jgi:hypothetical protein